MEDLRDIEFYFKDDSTESEDSGSWFISSCLTNHIRVLQQLFPDPTIPFETVVQVLMRNKFCPSIASIRVVKEQMPPVDSIQEGQIQLSFESVLQLLSNLAQRLFKHHMFAPICPTDTDRENLLLGLIDGQIFNIDVQETFNISPSTVKEMVKSIAQDEAWSLALQAQRTALSDGMITLVKRCETRVGRKHVRKAPERKKYPFQPKINPSPTKITQRSYEERAVKTKSPEYSFKPNIKTKHILGESTADFLDRMEFDIMSRRIRESEKLARKQADEEIVPEVDPYMNRASKSMLKENGLLNMHDGQVWERLSESRKDFMQDLRQVYREMESYDPETGQPLFHPVINKHSRRLIGTPVYHKELAPFIASESLYYNAQDRSEQQKLAEEQYEKELKLSRNQIRCSQKSSKYLQKGLDRDIREMFQLLDVADRGYLGLTHTMLMLQHFGLFPDVLLMNLEANGKEREFVMRIWHLVQSQEIQHAADLKKVSVLIHAVILNSTKKKNVAQSVLDQLNISTREDAGEIIQQLRLNYLSRSPNSQMTGFKLNRNLKNVQDHQIQAQKNSKKSRGALGYTLDGRPVQQLGEYPYRPSPEERLEALRAKYHQKEMETCTFKPQTNATRSSNGPKQAFERLYEAALEKKYKPKKPDSKFLEEQKELQHCTFQPQSPSSLSLSKRLERFQQIAKSPIEVKGFDESVTRTQYAQYLKHYQPEKPNVEVARTKDGHIVQEPFDLATETRAPTRLVQKHGYEVASKIVSSLEKKDPMLEINIHLSPTWTEHLTFWKTDDPRKVACQFAQKHDLSKKKLHQLIKRLEWEVRQHEEVQQEESPSEEEWETTAPIVPVPSAMIEKVQVVPIEKVQTTWTDTIEISKGPKEYFDPNLLEPSATTWSDFASVEIS